MDISNIILGISHISAALLIIVLSIPLVQQKVKMNKVYGVRFKKAFESDENWYKINMYGGRQLILWSIFLIVFGIITFFLPLKGNTFLIIVDAFAPCVIVIPVITSWVYARKL